MGRRNSVFPGELWRFLSRVDSELSLINIYQDIYGEDRLTRLSKQAELGRKPDEHSEFEGGGTEVQFMWWNSESQSNWRDGYVRAALLLEDPALRKKADDYIDRILATQDEDGYLGIRCV